MMGKGSTSPYPNRTRKPIQESGVKAKNVLVPGLQGSLVAPCLVSCVFQGGVLPWRWGISWHREMGWICRNPWTGTKKRLSFVLSIFLQLLPKWCEMEAGAQDKRPGFFLLLLLFLENFSYSWFTMLHWFQVYSKVNQLCIYIYACSFF